MKNKEVIERLDRVETDVKELKGDVHVLKSDVKELKGDVHVLKGDVKVLKGDVKELKGDMKGVKTGMALLHDQYHTIQDTLAFMITKMDQHWEETLRLFGVKDEKVASDLQGLGEGIRANRERLDDQETRLESLEAS